MRQLHLFFFSLYTDLTVCEICDKLFHMPSCIILNYKCSLCMIVTYINVLYINMFRCGSSTVLYSVRQIGYWSLEKPLLFSWPVNQ